MTVVLADAWQFTPFMILVLYAGLNTVDQSQIEAAQIDGAGVWMLLFRIMLPSIRPLIVFVLAIRLMDAFRFFDTIYVLTGRRAGRRRPRRSRCIPIALAFRLLQVGKASRAGRADVAVRRVLAVAADHRDRLPARTRRVLMRRRVRTQAAAVPCCWPPSPR